MKKKKLAKPTIFTLLPVHARIKNLWKIITLRILLRVVQYFYHRLTIDEKRRKKKFPKKFFLAASDKDAQISSVSHNPARSIEKEEKKKKRFDETRSRPGKKEKEKACVAEVANRISSEMANKQEPQCGKEANEQPSLSQALPFLSVSDVVELDVSVGRVSGHRSLASSISP